LYFLLGVGLGIVMGITGDHHWFPLHAHINLLGWVSMALFALLIRDRQPSRLFVTHFWVYNISLPVMCLMLWQVLAGNRAIEPILGMSSMVLAISCAMFVWGLWRTPLAR
jgi:hypothetical protein